MIEPDHFEITTDITGPIITKGYWKDHTYRDSIFKEGIAWKVAITQVGHKTWHSTIWRLDEDGQVEHHEATVVKVIYEDWEGPRRQ